MERYDELLQRTCTYIEYKLKKSIDPNISYNEDKYEIYIYTNCGEIDAFTYKTSPQQLEYCIRDNGCILELGNNVLTRFQQHVDNSFFKFN